MGTSLGDRCRGGLPPTGLGREWDRRQPLLLPSRLSRLTKEYEGSETPVLMRKTVLSPPRGDLDQTEKRQRRDRNFQDPGNT